MIGVVAGYSDPAYLESLREFGTPLWLDRAGGSVLLQPIAGTELQDARGPYPLFHFEHPERLRDELGNAVSFVGVADPLIAPSSSVLSTAFPDLCRPYKEHHVVNLDEPYPGPFSEGHRRNLDKAMRTVVVKALHERERCLDSWCELYDDLVLRHRIEGIARFSRDSFLAQLRHAAVRAFGAYVEGSLVAMSLWLLDGPRAYYHLGCSSTVGYAHRASYAMFFEAFHLLRSEGARTVLLGAGAGILGDATDGLSRFKSGWASERRMAHLCGLIVDRSAYKRLARDLDTGYFPAYRDPRLVGAQAA